MSSQNRGDNHPTHLTVLYQGDNMNTLQVRAILLGASFGKIVVKYEATDADKNMQILNVLNKDQTEAKFKKKYFTEKDLLDNFAATPFKCEVVEVKLPAIKIPEVGDSFTVAVKSASLF